MKKFNLFVTIALCVVMVTGCDSDVLDQSNPNRATSDSFWKTQDDAVKATTAVYEGLTYEGAYMRMTHAQQDFPSDDARSDSPWPVLQSIGRFTQAATSDGVFWPWRDWYHTIYRANQVIAYVPNIQMDETLRNRLVGEAKFLRAFAYFHLVKFYNRVPLILEPATSKEDYLKPQAEPSEVWAAIQKDLEDAQAVLPRTYPANEIGRATWGAATAYLGVAHLWNKRYAQADAEFKKIIDSGLYSLVANPRDNGGYENENNAESIFEIQFSREVGGTLNGWAGEPSPDWGETHARSITYAPQGFGWADSTPTWGLHDTFKQEQTVNGTDDPRLHATMFYNAPGMTIYGRPWEQQYAANPNVIYWRKYQSDIPGGNENDMRSGINFRVMRLADVLLMYAETRNELGDRAAAARYITMVRNRANLPNREAEFAALGQEAMRDRIAHERYLELAGEGKRFEDIKRWGWLSNAAKLAELKARDPEFNQYSPGREFLPIPQVEMDVNPLLVQNPGY